MAGPPTLAGIVYANAVIKLGSEELPAQTGGMDSPKWIDGIIDQAMAELLGPAGNEFYAELIRQTQENRERIEREVRSRFHDVFAEVFSELTGLQMNPRTLETAARIEAHRRIQRDISRQISEEEQAFRERVNRLYGWAQEQKRKGCTGCEALPADEPR
jgi:hypothetical protein